MANKEGFNIRSEALPQRSDDDRCVARILVDIRDPQRREDLRTALARGLSAWDRPPQWLVSLYYEIIRDQAHDAARKDMDTLTAYTRAQVKITPRRGNKG